MNSEAPQGTILVSVVMPAITQAILDVDPKGAPLSRLASSSGEAYMNVSVADSTGMHPLTGGEAAVAEGTILDMSLNNVSSDSSLITLIIISDRKVMAQMTIITLGVPRAQRASAWIM